MTTTILFDFDGTIADSMKAMIEAYNKSAESFNLPKIEEKNIEKLRGKGFREIIAEFKIPFYKIPFMVRKVRRDFSGNVSSIQPFNHITETLIELKKRGYKIGILTSNTVKNVEEFLTNHDMEVDCIYSESNIFGKDRAMKNFLKKNKVAPDEVIYIGDEVRDIEACRKAGIKIVSVTYGFNTKELLLKNNPDFIVDAPQELLTIII